MNDAKIAAANWKANGDLQQAKRWLDELEPVSGVSAVFCPPAFMMSALAELAVSKGVRLCSQDCSQYPPGAYTGEVPAELLSSAGCQGVVVGHSERRQLLRENAELLERKCQRALEAGLFVIYCLGESLEQRDQGQTNSVLEQQLQLLQRVQFPPQLICLAYEPVWAIGTGRAASAEQAHAAHAHIANWLAQNQANLKQTPILYGGSVKAANSAELAASEHVHGFLVGGASLSAATFNPIMSSLQ